jgi:hypothetical protein
MLRITYKLRCFLWRQNNPEVNYSPTRISGGGGVFVEKVSRSRPEGKRPLGRPRRSWEDNIKMDLEEVGGGRVDWMELAQDRDSWRALVGTVRDFRVP